MTSRLLAPDELEASIARGVRRLRVTSGADLVFGGPVETGRGGRQAVGIRTLEGNLGRSLAGLRVVAGVGLGGKALALGRPVLIRDYFNSPEIVHDYDDAVAPERIATVLAVPVVVAGDLRGLLYVASRTDVPLTRAVVGQAVAVSRSIERDVLVAEGVRRRLGAAPGGGGPLGGAPRVDPERASLRAELDEAIAAVPDPSLRQRLADLSARLLGAGGATAPGDTADRAVGTRPGVSGIPAEPVVRLTRREHEVLRHVAAGRTNAAVAEALGLRTPTVKAYLKTAARKLGAANRVDAVRLAREAGLLP